MFLLGPVTWQGNGLGKAFPGQNRNWTPVWKRKLLWLLFPPVKLLPVACDRSTDKIYFIKEGERKL